MLAKFDIHEELPVERPRLGIGLSLAASVVFGALVVAEQLPILKVWIAIQGVITSAVGVKYAQELKELEPHRIIQKEARLNLLSEQAALQATAFRPVSMHQKQTISPIDDGGKSLQFYDWEDLPDENTGIMIAGNAGSGKTSVCCWVLGKLTERKPAIIEVLDPHGGINKIWHDLGMNPICEYDEIEARLIAAIAELDLRRARAKRGEPIGQQYIFVCDELDSCLDNFQNPEMIAKAIKRLGKEGRKYDLSLIFITHTSNAGVKGIDAQERNCYVNILLGGTAANYTRYNYKRTDSESLFLNNQAYPCIVVSGGFPTPAIHPTHGTYTKFKKQGNPPLNLLPINRIEAVQSDGVATSIDFLERCHGIDCSSVATNEKNIESCPHCGSEKIKWLSQNAGRKQCKKCGKTWTIKQ